MSLWETISQLRREAKEQRLLKKFMEACRNQEDVKQVEKCIEEGVDVNARFPELNGGTILHLLPSICGFNGNDFTIARILISKGADVNAVDDEGKTPLHKAAADCKQHFLELYVEKGANPYAKDKFGKTPVDVAREGFMQYIPIMVRGSSKNVEPSETIEVKVNENVPPKTLEITKEAYLKLSKEEICNRLIAPDGLNEARKVFDGNFKELVKCMDYNTAMRAYVHIYKELNNQEKEDYTKATKSLKKDNQPPVATQKTQKER